uniref:Uncharacterized protein n=1 Tax=Chenopodium quinoa TaxID=63459 RepID=A0A803MAS3_CHEQI
VPQRLYILDELKLTGIEAASLLSPVDTTLCSIERNLQIAAVLGGVTAWNAFELSPQQLFYISLGLLLLWTLDLTNTGKMSSTMLNIFSCITLTGLATEYLLYGYVEGGLADINKLDGMLKSLGFTQKKADSQLRLAVLNTILLLPRHEEARAKLADAMSNRMYVGSYINVIEEAVDDEDLVQNL